MDKDTSERLKQAWKLLSEIGIEFVFPCDRGYVTLSKDQFTRLVEVGPEQFQAELYGVTIEHYEAWLEAREERQCMGTTKKGKRCNALLKIPYSPRDFDPEYDLYCVHHKPY